MAASLAAGFSNRAGLAFSGAGAESTNVILTTTNAVVEDSVLMASGSVTITADASSAHASSANGSKTLTPVGTANEFTTKLTDFRNGDLNLHFLHVNKAPKGRSCKACHEMHAGTQEKHVRKEVVYGKSWKLPVNYTKTPTGGRCVVGCHKPKDYDRTNPVVY